MINGAEPGMFRPGEQWQIDMKNTEPNRETNRLGNSEAASSELPLPNRTLHVPVQNMPVPTSQDVRETLDRTQDCDLFATLKDGTAAVETLRLLIPGFELLEELGRGAFGVVYRARDEKLDRQVAIKVSLIDDPNRREQYIKEARNAAKIETQGIVPVFQVGTLSGGQPFVVQRLIDGSTLREILSKSGSIGVHHACWLMSEIASVVAKAHALGMIHRDIKPDNILLDTSGQPWVADFGLAILEEEQSEHAGERAGTPLYMSPEQLCGRVDWLDGRTDIYSMGVMLYEMLVGRTPFEARNMVELEQQVLHRDPKPITQRAPHCPPELDVIFRNCCAKKVEDRYGNANALVDDLQLLLAELPEDKSSSSPFVAEGGFVPLSERKIGSSRAASRNASRRKTLRQYSPLHGTLALGRPRSILKRLAIPTSIMLFAGCLGSLMLLLRPGRSTLPDQYSAEATLPEAILPGLPDPNPQDIQVENTPVRPFRVSKGSEATHHTIAAAIADADIGETITILPGTYYEALEFDRAVRLVGEGKRGDIVLVGENSSAIVVDFKEESGAKTGRDVSSAIELANLTVEGNKTDQVDFNTIEVKRGSLALTDCNINSRSWDCIKLQPQSSLHADHCSFSSSTQPAISAEQASGLIVVDCNFDIRPLTLERTSIGIQASHSGGLVQRCTFAGSGAATGIHWKETSQQVVIEDANFQNCEFGVVAQACADFHVGGAKHTQLRGCRNGLLLEGCTALIGNCDIHGVEGGIGIRVVDEADLPQMPTVQLSNCSVSGYDTGLSVEHAHVSTQKLNCEKSTTAGLRLVRQGQLKMEDSIVSASEKIGIAILNSSVNIVNCKVLAGDYIGVYLDAGSVASNFTKCTFDQNFAGLLLVGGSAELEQCIFTANSVGVLVASHEQASQAPAAQVMPISLDILGGEFRENEKGNLQVLVACLLTIRGWEDAPRSEILSPKIIGELESKRKGDVYEISVKSTENTKAAPTQTSVE